MDESTEIDEQTYRRAMLMSIRTIGVILLLLLIVSVLSLLELQALNDFVD